MPDPARQPTVRHRVVAGPQAVAAAGLPPMQHAATVLPLPAGRLLAVWYAASFETAADTVLVRSVFEPDEGWTPPEEALRVPGFALGNPVLWRRDRPPGAARPDAGVGTLELFLALLPDPAWTSARVASLTSDDEAASWHDLRFLSSFRGLMTKGRPLRIGERCMLPVYDERTFAPMVLLSTGRGARWELVGETTARGRAIQPCLVRTPDGVLMLSRSREGRILRSLSRDAGRSWAASARTQLPNPNSGIDLIRLVDGRLCLAYNPSDRDRSSLALAFSDDHGRRWTRPLPIQASPAEVSYPSMAQDDAGVLHVLYSLERHSIVHASVDVGGLAVGGSAGLAPDR